MRLSSRRPRCMVPSIPSRRGVDPKRTWRQTQADVAPNPNPCQLFPIAAHCRFEPFQGLGRSRKRHPPLAVSCSSPKKYITEMLYQFSLALRLMPSAPREATPFVSERGHYIEPLPISRKAGALKIFPLVADPTSGRRFGRARRRRSWRIDASEDGEGSISREPPCLTRPCAVLPVLAIYQARNSRVCSDGRSGLRWSEERDFIDLTAPCRPELDGAAEPRILAYNPASSPVRRRPDFEGFMMLDDNDDPKAIADLANKLKILSEITTAEKYPNVNPLWEIAKDIDFIRLNLKFYGYDLARRLAAALPPRPHLQASKVHLPWKPSTQLDLSSDWAAYWTRQLKIALVFHRKVWELAYVLQTLHDHNLIRPGARGIGFGCGTEPIPSYLASRGVEVTITDIPPEDQASKGWAETAQHAASLQNCLFPDLVSSEVFQERARIAYVDMNAIPDSLKDYDFCWSICALEHLGSILERGGFHCEFSGHPQTGRFGGAHDRIQFLRRRANDRQLGHGLPAQKGLLEFGRSTRGARPHDTEDRLRYWAGTIGPFYRSAAIRVPSQRIGSGLVGV